MNFIMPGVAAVLISYALASTFRMRPLSCASLSAGLTLLYGLLSHNM